MVQINLTLDLCGAMVAMILLLSCLGEGVCKQRKDSHFLGLLLLLLVLLLTDGLDWGMNGHERMRTLLLVSNMINYSAGYLIVLTFVRYLADFLEEDRMMRFVIGIFDVFGCLSVGMMFVNLFSGIYYYIDVAGWYHRGDLYWVSQVFPAVALGICAIVIVCGKGLLIRERMVFLSYLLFPLVGIVIDLYIAELALTYTGAVISSLLIYIQIDAMREKKIAQQEMELAQQKTELTQSQVRMMLSQIQPHFLYNALSSIQELCRKNPQEAERAITEFSDFLRGNMASLTIDKPVSFEQELKHTNNYLALEQMRFEECLTVIYRIETTRFRIPTLTLQPIVENAVRYGVTKKEEGGTVIIAVKEEPDCYEIMVSDDGVGFDLKSMKTDDRMHIGIENVRKRLEFVGGELQIASTVGVGTEVTIRVRKQKEGEGVC